MYQFALHPNNRKETKGRQIQKQYIPKYSEKELENLKENVSSVRFEQMKRQKKLITRCQF